MKHIRYLLLWAMIMLTGVSASVIAAEETFEMSRVSQSQPMLTMTKVTHAKDKTAIDFVWKTEGKKQNIGVYPPGHDLAFYITDVKKAKKYQLLEVEGIPLRPNTLKIPNGVTRSFRLIFERVPMKRFHLIEGATEMTEATAWHFSNVELKNSNH